MRAAGLLAFCLFSSILSTVTSLKCQTCVAPLNECEGEKVKVKECKEDEEFCSTIVFNSTITKNPTNLVIKECSKRDQCLSGLFSSTVIGGRFELTKVNCCQTDVCNAEPLLCYRVEEQNRTEQKEQNRAGKDPGRRLVQPPAQAGGPILSQTVEKYEEFQENWFRCKSCYAQDVDSCEANQKVQCVGKEDQCITITSTMVAYGNFTEKHTFQGCSTSNLCSYPQGVSHMGDGQFQFNVTTLKCRDASLPDPDYIW